MTLADIQIGIECLLNRDAEYKIQLVQSKYDEVELEVMSQFMVQEAVFRDDQ